MSENKSSKLTFLGSITEAIDEANGLVWKADLIQAGLTANRFYYPKEVLEAAVPLFERVPVFTDHPSLRERTEHPERSVKDIAGWISNPQWSPSGGPDGRGAITGTLHLLESNPIAARVREAYERNNINLFQLSIHGAVKARAVHESSGSYWEIAEINAIRSVDLVTAAAAGGRIVDVMHSLSKENDMGLLESMTVEEILAARPDIVEALHAKDEQTQKEAMEIKAKSISAAIDEVLDKVAGVKDLPEAVRNAVDAARAAAKKEDYAALVKQLKAISDEAALPEDVRKDVVALIAKIGYSEPAYGDATESKPVEEEEQKVEMNSITPDKIVVESKGVVVDESIKDELSALKRAFQLSNCAKLLQEKLSAASLPNPIKEKIAKHFAGQVFESSDLDKMIAEETEVYGKIVAESPNPHVRIVQAPQDKMVDVVTATIMGRDYNGQRPLGSIRRAYTLFKGQNPYTYSSAQLASMMIQESIGWDNYTSLEALESIGWTAVFGTSMNRALVEDYKELPFNDWELIVSDVKPLNDMKAQSVTRIGYYGALPTVSAGAPYTYASSPGEEEATYSPAKRGLLEEWTWEQALNDDLGALRKIPQRLALAAKVTLYKFIFDFLANNSTCTYDSVALFHSNHANYGTSALADSTLTAAKLAMRKQAALSAADVTLAIHPKYIVVPPDLEATALSLIQGDWQLGTTAYAPNIHKNSLQIIVVDYWTDADNWYLVADPKFVPTIEVGFLDGKREPELFTEAANSGSNFSADKVVIKVRYVFGGTIIDHRGFYGAIVS